MPRPGEGYGSINFHIICEAPLPSAGEPILAPTPRRRRRTERARTTQQANKQRNSIPTAALSLNFLIIQTLQLLHLLHSYFSSSSSKKERNRKRAKEPVKGYE
jgi:hypothetical protein